MRKKALVDRSLESCGLGDETLKKTKKSNKQENLFSYLRINQDWVRALNLGDSLFLMVFLAEI